MNDQGLDKLFRDRLEGLEENPPSVAWDRLNDQLQGRKKKAGWIFLRVAAVLILIACSVFVFNRSLFSEDEQPQLTENVESTENNQDTEEAVISDQAETALAENRESENNNKSNNNNSSTSDKPAEPSTPNRAAPAPSEPVKKQQEQPAPKKSSRQIKLMQSPQTQVLAQNESEAAHTIEEAASETLGIAQADQQPGEETVDQETVTLDEAKEPRKVKITYKKSPSPPEPTLALTDEPQEKTSAVKRLWQKAQNLKNGQVGLADIRSAKDQLLVIGKKKKEREKEVKSN